MPHQIKRDKYFWTIALQTVCVNIFLGSFGPAQPLLRADQGTSLTIAGLHGTALGVASIAALPILILHTALVAAEQVGWVLASLQWA
jgi:hypothetical protein